MADEPLITGNAVRARWQTIRSNPDCNLSLAPDSVAEYLARRESELVRDRIRETLIQLAQYRVAQKLFRSKEPSGKGPLATCEGLEAFLVPAVEEALPLSAALDALDTTPGLKQSFANAFVEDVNGLLDDWEKDRFSGEPYADEQAITAVLLPNRLAEVTAIDIVEAAAMACRVLTHILTLKLARPHEEATFRELIGDRLEDDRMFRSLKNGIDFLVRSFQKGAGRDDEEKITSARIAGKIGSGWSWTDWQGLPPMLFFTAASIDAFAELDLYLIRSAADDSWGKENQERQKIIEFCKNHGKALELLQLCVDMSRRWVQSSVLNALSTGDGVLTENNPEFFANTEGIKPFESELRRAGLKEAPMLFYNNLYALQILLWSWADWNDEGTAPDLSAKQKINRALAQLVYNYDSIPAVKTILNRIPYIIYLPGKEHFNKETEKQRPYLDSGFLPLLTRLLVLFVVYGVGDRNLLEPVIRKLYVELLQNRHRVIPAYTALWSSDAIEIFSTQRAVQALTFYFAYARGKEQMEAQRSNFAQGTTTDDAIVFRNRTGFSLVLEAVRDGAAPAPVEVLQTALAPTVDHARTLPDPMSVDNFAAYCRQIADFKVTSNADEEARNLQMSASDEANLLFDAIKTNRVRDALSANLILYSIARIQQMPIREGVIRGQELNLLSKLSKELFIS
jgi:hypothetical protein